MTNQEIKTFSFSDYYNQFNGGFNTVENKVKNLLSIAKLEVPEKTLQKIVKEWGYLSTNTAMTNYLNLLKIIKNNNVG